MQVVLVVDGELSLAVLYLAKVRHAVVTFYHQIYLRPGVAVVRSAISPAEHPGDHARHAQLGLDLVYVLQCDALERMSTPNAHGLRLLGKEILLRRLAEAERLLKTTDLQIAEIASLCGFCSSAYFVERFRAAYGTTPRHWRLERRA